MTQNKARQFHTGKCQQPKTSAIDHQPVLKVQSKISSVCKSIDRLKIIPIETLPSELLFSIFNFLTVRDATLSISNLNRFFYEEYCKYLESGQVNELNICKEVYLQSYNSHKQGVISMEELYNTYFRSKNELNRMKLFRTVFMKRLLNGVNKLVLEKLKNFPIGLFVSQNRDTSPQTIGLRKKSKKPTQHQTKQLCVLRDFSQFWKGIKTLGIDGTTLCSLPIEGSDFVDDEDDNGYQLLSRVVRPHLERLEHISLKNLKLSSRDAFYMREFVNSFPSLKSLEISNTQLYESESFPLFQAETNLESLRILESIPNCESMVSKCSGLKTLTLHHFHGSISQLLRDLHHLTDLSLHKSVIGNFDDTDLTFPPKLQAFSLTCCNLHSEEVKEEYPITRIFTQLESLKQLESIKIMKCTLFDNFVDFRENQESFDHFLNAIPESIICICVDNLEKVTSLKTISRFKSLEVLTCLNLCNFESVDNLLLIKCFHRLKELSLDRLHISGKQLNSFLQELSLFPCCKTLKKITLERLSAEKTPTFSTQYFNFTSIPSLLQLEELKIVGFYCVAEELTQNEMRASLLQTCPMLRLFVLSISRDKKTNSRGFSTSKDVNPLLRIDFTDNNTASTAPKHHKKPKKRGNLDDML